MKPVMVNGMGPMPPRAQKGFEPLPVPRVPPETLRKLDHPEWLEGFARSLQLRTTVEMTPYRVGVLNRVLLCAEYIRLLRYDILKLEKGLTRVAPSEAAPGLRPASRSDEPAIGGEGREEVRSKGEKP